MILVCLEKNNCFLYSSLTDYHPVLSQVNRVCYRSFYQLIKLRYTFFGFDFSLFT